MPLNSQFKNPLLRKSSPAPQKNEWLTGGAQPAPGNNEPRGYPAPGTERPPETGKRLFQAPWKPGPQAPRLPASPRPGERQGRQQLAPSPGLRSYAPGSLPQTPDAQRPGPVAPFAPGQDTPRQQVPSGGNNGLPGPPPSTFGFSADSGNGPRMAAPPPTLRSAAPLGPGVGAPTYPPSPPRQSYNSFNRVQPGPSFSTPGTGTLTTSPAPRPGMYTPRQTGQNNPPGASWQNVRSGRRDGPPGDPRGKRRKKKRRVPIWARIVIGLLLFFIVLGGGSLIYYQVNFAGSLNSIVGQAVPRANGEVDPNSNLTNGILSGPRVNILLLGSDTDQKFNGTYLAQTDIIVTIDPASKTVGMLSIPRDFYINVPGHGMRKLDEAFGLGGVDLSRQTIQQDFGIPINYYAWVGLDGFIKVIDEVGGVDVDVSHPIVDGNYPDDVGKSANDPYAIERLYIPPGPQHLDGPTALEYVRSRHADLVGDFGRSARQQQVLTALKPKLENPAIFSKLSNIANDLKDYLKTDMQLPDVLKLMNFARSLNLTQIKRLTLGPPYSTSGTAPAGSGPDAGADVVFPNCEAIIPAIAQMLQLGNNAACNIQASSGGGGQPGLPLAYTSGNPSALATAISNSTANVSGPVDLNGGSGGPANLFGVQSLLDLLFMGVFESPDVF